MMLVSVVAEILEEYTMVLTKVLEHVFNQAPLPRRIRFLILRNLPSASNIALNPSLLSPPPPVPVRSTHY
ncbi:Mediator of RNA polymerase II transcription subunit 17 [Bienertia sinuspersici]